MGSLVTTVLSAVATARQALSDLLVPVTITVQVLAAYTPGQAQTYTSQDVVGEGAVVDYDAFERQMQLIPATDVKLLLFIDAVPKTNDLLNVNGATYRAIDVKRIMAGATIVMFEIQARPA